MDPVKLTAPLVALAVGVAFVAGDGKMHIEPKVEDDSPTFTSRASGLAVSGYTATLGSTVFAIPIDLERSENAPGLSAAMAELVSKTIKRS